MQLKDLKKFKLPDSPGVYFFLGPSKLGGGSLKGKEILYIGKATSLKDRVKSYFGKDLIETRGPLILDMVFKADKIKFEKTDSVLEALILEADFIKKYQPKYNTKEKSDKSFNYVVITDEEVPKVLIKREKDLKNYTSSFFLPLRPSQSTGWDPRAQKIERSSVFGPFPNGSQLKEALRIVRKIFPFVDSASSKRNNQEFYRQIHLTPENLEEYKRNIRHLELFFRGKKKELVKSLQKEMRIEAKLRNFEQAARIRNQIFALNHINDVSLLKLEPKNLGNEVFRIEAYDIAHMGGKNMVGVMTVVENGLPNKAEYRKFNIKTQDNANDTGALFEVLDRRIGHPEWSFPALIVVDGSTAQINFARSALSKYGVDIPIVAVTKNEKHKPESIKGDSKYVKKYESEILLANSEAHRFAIKFHKDKRNKNFLK